MPISRSSDLLPAVAPPAAAAAERGHPDASPRRKKGRQSVFTTRQKNWVVFQRNVFLSSCEAAPIPPCTVERMWTEAKRIGVLPGDVKKEAVRWVCRTVDGHIQQLQDEGFISVFHTASNS